MLLASNSFWLAVVDGPVLSVERACVSVNVFILKLQSEFIFTFAVYSQHEMCKFILGSGKYKLQNMYKVHTASSSKNNRKTHCTHSV